MKRTIAIALLLAACFSATARGEFEESWYNPEAGMVDPIVDDIDLDGDLDILGYKMINFAIIDGSDGEIAQVMGIPKWAPRVANLDDTPRLELLMAIESMGIDASNARFLVYRKSFMGWDPYFEEAGRGSAIFAVADIDGDGNAEIIAAPNGKTIKVYSSNPIVSRWNRDLGYITQPALGDVNGDGVIDIICLDKVSNFDGKYLESVDPFMGPVHYDLDMVALSGTDGREIMRASKTGRFIRPPITADLNGDGSDEILLFLETGFYVIDGNSNIVFKIEIEGGFPWGAVGDFHSTQGLEIVLISPDGKVTAIDNLGAELWTGESVEAFGSPAIADVEGDGNQYILVPVEGAVEIYSGERGSSSTGISVSGKARSLLVADVDGDDTLDILVGTDQGLSLWETESQGNVEWAGSTGDAQGTYSYRLSREYVKRASMPSEFKLFNWKRLGIVVALLALAGGAGLFFYRLSQSVKETTQTTPLAASLLPLEAEYARNRDNTVAIRKLAMEYASQNVTALKASEVYQKALKLDPNQPLIVKALASSFLIRNALTPESEEIFRRAVELAPNDQKVITGIVTILSQNKRVDPESLKLYERFYYLGLDNPKATALIARELARQNSHEPFAVHVYGRHLKQEPTDFDVTNALLDYNKSILNMEEYVSIARSIMDNPRLAITLKIKMARDLMAADYLDDAGALVNSAVESNPNDVEAWWAAKEFRAKSNDTDGAAKAANRLVQIYTDLQRANPLQTDIKMALGKLFKELGNPGAAISQLGTIAPNDPNYHDAALILTELYIEVGELDRASTLFQTIPNGETLHPGIRKKIEELRTSKVFAAQTGGADRTAIIGEEYKTVVQGAAPTRYKIVGELGRGGMGVVYKALDTVLKREVAYKVLPEDLRNHPEVVKSFESEAQNLAKLSHPNIVTIYDAGQQAGTLFFVMQYIDGMDLREEMKKSEGGLPTKRVVEVAKQVLRALAYAHEKRIIHRDIKTSNVMVTKDGSVMLMDFGLSKILEGAQSEKTKVSGTPYYMSPEQIHGVGVDHLTDIYSFGAMLYEMSAGRVPFPVGDVAYHHLHTQPEPPTKLNPAIPESLVSIILKCLEKEKAKRYQNAADIIKELDFVM